MTDQRFNDLINGPLCHPMPSFMILRLIAALRFVVEQTGAAGEKALESHCEGRQAQDDLKEGFGE